ncbi:MAG: hypothetical protein HWN67_17255 [Candidatus Helarchaeota archaeon]|nr:hypothetical protein [Candidatus Helarchaeota archaeon]
MEIKLKKNEALKVIGPSKIEVVDGEIEIFGKKIYGDQSFLVKKGKALPIEAKKLSILQINTESSENIKKIEGPTIPDDRRELVKKILGLPKPCKILLIGDGDTGKTSLITYLANKSFENGYKIAVLDLDVGQHDIGPPCTIGLGVLKESVLELKDVPIDSLFFIGNTSPAGHMIRCLAGIGRLLENASKADVILIDTSGWIKGNAARSYKTSKIELIRPNLIVGIQRETEIEHLLNPFHKIIPIHRISVSIDVHPRTYNDRRFLREVSFRDYFLNAQSRSFNCDEINFAYSLFKTGTLPDEETLKTIEETLDLKSKYCEISKDGIFFVQDEEKFWKIDNLNLLKEKFNAHYIHIVQLGVEKGIIVGLVGTDVHYGIGIIEEIDYEENIIKVFTPIKENIKQIQFGSLKISKSGVELEKIKHLF